MINRAKPPDPPDANAASRRARLPWLASLSFRRKLALIVGIPSAVAILGSLLALGRVAANYNRARVLEKSNASSTYLIQAAATQAKERGFTAAALADPGAESSRRMIPELRTQGDQLLDSALRAAQAALHGNAILSVAYRQLQEMRRARDLKRVVVDEALSHSQPNPPAFVQDWFDTQTRLIQTERVFGSTLFVAQNPYELIIQYNGYIKANVFVASEFAGRERARIGRCIASRQPIPPERLEELQRWRGVVEENLAAIAQLRANPAMSAPVLQSIDAMESAFLGDYEKVRQAVYTASRQHEPYPLTTDEWIAASTRGINGIIAVSDRIGDEAALISGKQAAFSLINVLLILGMVGLLLLAVVASVFVARHLTKRLGEIREAAERIARGDYSRPIVGDDPPGAVGDEFSELARVFNMMQGKVETGIEQLQAEKAGVEARVAERTRELSAANARLLALNAEKDTFLGICTHDLKNPLCGIVGMAGLIETDAGDAEEVRRHAADILQASEFMFQLVTNLLDIGAIEQGKFNLKLEALDLTSLVIRGAENYRRRAEAKGIGLNVSAPEEKFMISADEQAVTQVVDNLVSNAVKYTPPGGEVRIGVGRGTTPTQGGPAPGSRAVFSVGDTGPGLSRADQTHLFEKYARLSSRVTGGESSTGLGLSIVKKLVEAMGGTVQCRSELGHGSTFTVEFPVAVQTA